MKRIRFLIVVGIVAAACGACTTTAAWGQQAPASSQTAASNSLHQLFGTINRIEGSQLTIEARNQRMVQVDATAAIKSSRTIILTSGRAVSVLGSYDEKGVLHAQSIQRAKSSQAGWPQDR